MRALVLVLIVYWAVPVFLVSTLTNIDVLAEKYPWLAPVLDWSPFAQSLLRDFLPTVALSALVHAVPEIMRKLSEWQGWPFMSDIARGILEKYPLSNYTKSQEEYLCLKCFMC